MVSLQGIKPHALVVVVASCLTLAIDREHSVFVRALSQAFVSGPSISALLGAGPRGVALTSAVAMLSRSAYYIAMAHGWSPVPESVALLASRRGAAYVHLPLTSIAADFLNMGLTPLRLPAALVLLLVNVCCMCWMYSKPPISLFPGQLAALAMISAGGSACMMCLKAWLQRQHVNSSASGAPVGPGLAAPACQALGTAASDQDANERDTVTMDVMQAACSAVANASAEAPGGARANSSSMHAERPPGTTALREVPKHIQTMSHAVAGSTPHSMAPASHDTAPHSMVHNDLDTTLHSPPPSTLRQHMQVSVKMQGHALTVATLPADYLERIRMVVHRTSAGSLQVLGGAAREGCVLISLDAVMAEPVRQQETGDVSCNPSAAAIATTAAQLEATLQHELLGALGLPSESSSIKVSVLLAQEEGGSPSGPALSQHGSCTCVQLSAVQPHVVRPARGSQLVALDLKIQHPPGHRLLAYKPLPAGQSAAQHEQDTDVVLAVRCGTTYLPACWEGRTATAEGSQGHLAISLPAPERMATCTGMPCISRPLVLEVCAGHRVVSSCRLYPAAVQQLPRGTAASCQAEAVASDLEVLASRSDAPVSFASFLDDLDGLAALVDQANACDPAIGEVLSARPRQQAVLRAIAGQLVCRLVRHAVRHGLLHLSTQLVHLQSSPSGAALLGPVHYLAHVPGAARALVTAAADSGSGDMVQHVGEWVARLGQGSLTSTTLGPAPHLASRAAHRPAVVSAAAGTSMTGACAAPRPVPSAVAAVPSRRDSMAAAAQHEASLGRSGLARALLHGFKDARLEAAYAQMQLDQLRWSISLAIMSRFCIVVFLLSLVVQHLGVKAALPLLAAPCSLLAAAAWLGVCSMGHGQRALLLPARNLSIAAHAALMLPVAIGWADMKGSSRWVAWCHSFYALCFESHPAAKLALALGVPLTDRLSVPFQTLQTLSTYVILLDSGSLSSCAALLSSLCINAAWAAGASGWNGWCRHAFIHRVLRNSLPDDGLVMTATCSSSSAVVDK